MLRVAGWGPIDEQTILRFLAALEARVMARLGPSGASLCLTSCPGAERGRLAGLA